MPGKKKKARKTKGKSKKKEKAEAETKDMLVTTRKFLKMYSLNCAASNSAQSARIIKSCKESMEEEKPFGKFVLESTPLPPPPEPIVAKPQPVKKVPPLAAESGAVVTTVVQPATPPATSLPLLLQPLVKSLSESSYKYIRCLHVWGIPLNDDNAVALALFLESSLGTNIKVLELRDTNLSPWAVIRISNTLTKVQLTLLNLDYNRIQYGGLARLCEKLQQNVFIQTLSLNFCNLDSSCGDVLGVLGATSHIRYLSLVGNRLECDGCTELMRPIVALCESTACDEMKDFLTSGSPDRELKKEESDKAVKLPLPLLAKLDLRDNAIDAHGVCGEGDMTFEPVICMRAVKRWIISSPILEELNFDHNLISDGGARELLQALQIRKEAGLPVMKVTVTHHTCPELFEEIIALSSEKKNKKGKKKGKKKT